MTFSTPESESFGLMVDLFKNWLRGARLVEIALLLELVGQEIGRRGYALTWRTTPPLENRPTQ